ncbi:glycoside hydrolase family 31 protein [Neolentinus lepideus HHB14362 ss-1]|uniref:Glycoside hydrolase family 31 protein n=1 Tax=Neolentinus lepideus HHB14362 ss-1 TaxID=1314782 RepID=A0A165URE3_9AGAM|nr:glycoside hydrolase family 31 protein [Neolentinus lepideus HHB14362 ss-1]
MHNHFAGLYNELVFNLLKKRFGAGEAVVFARLTHADGTRFITFVASTGVETASRLSRRGGLSLTVSGFAFSHEIEGVEAIQANQRGSPNMRAMFIGFFSIRTTHYFGKQWRWTSFFHLKGTVQGPVRVKEKVPIDKIPVCVRPDTLLNLGSEDAGRPGYE